MRDLSDRVLFGILAFVGGFLALGALPVAGEAWVELKGTDFSGDASERFSASQHGKSSVNYVYASPTGPLGMPPWFMVSLCAVAPEGHKLRLPPKDITKDFHITLPDKRRPIPEPLPKGHPEPGFKIRMIKGWNWTPEQYLDEIPVLARYKINFLMNCYTSLFSGFPEFKNEWWQPIPKARKRAYEKVFAACREHGIEFVFSVHPQFCSPRPIDPESDEDFEQFWQHYEWALGQGITWFNIQYDDVAASMEQFAFVNKLLGRLRERNPEAELIFCPTHYWGDGTGPKAKPYNERLAKELHPDVYLFWTGNAVVTPQITTACAEEYKSIVKHRVIIWDNYPVNDNHPTMHLGPVTGRDPDLCEVAIGYLSNPLCKQNQINRIPLITCADYAYNPWAYDPAHSIGQAILQMSANAAQAQVLKDLVEAYPGMLIWGGGPRANPARDRFDRLAATPHSRFVADGYIRQMENLSIRLVEEFPEHFGPATDTLIEDLDWMIARYEEVYGTRW